MKTRPRHHTRSATALGTALAAAILMSAGCATVEPFDLDGSRADGTVTMGAELGMFARDIDWSSAQEAALRRCMAWGYTAAEPFTGVRTRCTDPGVFGGCDREEITRTYQCLE